MNRTTALFLTLAVLLAHTLAIYKVESGAFAPPYDQAHVAYRMAHNFVEHRHFAWDPTLEAAESYPSILWVGVATIAERLYLPVTTFCQTIGVISALLSVLVLASFSPGRLAGVIAPLLFVVCGGIAAAAANGMETAFFALLVITAFLAFERRRAAILAVALSLACLTRPEGGLFALALFALELANLRHKDKESRRAVMWRSFLAPLFTALMIVIARRSLVGQVFSPWTASMLAMDARSWLQGLGYLRDFMTGSGWMILILFPLWYGFRWALLGTGRRAILLALFWAAMVAAGGGDPLPYSQAMIPVAAILMVAMQESMTVALDSRRPALPSVVWTLFLLALGSSALASKFPGDLGPLPLEGAQRAWMTSHTTPRFGYTQPLGRLGLVEEIEATRELRSLGIFLRDHLDRGHAVMTPWPGATGYISRLTVIDLLGRATIPPGSEMPRSWTGLPRVDVVRALALAPDYIVPSIRRGRRAPTAIEIESEWTHAIDVSAEEAPSLAIREALRRYELITVPIPIGNTNYSGAPTRRFYMLRNRELDLAPELELSLVGDRFEVEVSHTAHDQIVDLRVQLRDASGKLSSMRPTGEWVKRPTALARTSILLVPSSSAIKLLSGRLPPDTNVVELVCVLRNPGAHGEQVFAACSQPQSRRL
jgi:hypothetical protein